MTVVKHPVALVAVFTWLGLVAGVVFMASWLKYRAFGVSLPVGAGIDMKLLPALLLVEWVLALAVLADLIMGKSSIPMFALIAFPVLLLAVQTLWLQPAMDTDALLVFHGQGDAGNGLRTAHTAAEVIKVTALATLGIAQFKRFQPRRRSGDQQPKETIMKITPERTVGSIVAEDYRAAAVLTKYGIDFCCKGGRSVQEVCEKKSIDQKKLADDITTLLARDAKSGEDARTWPLDRLADHVETIHHRYVEERGPIIQQYLAKLCKVHGDRHPELFTINDEFNACVGAMAMHMKKEELMLFPFMRNLAKSDRTGEPLRKPHFGTVENPVNAMMEDHNDEGERFGRMRGVSDGFTTPADGCATYATAFNMLKEFEDDLHLHIHLENNIMFPRAIEMEKSLVHAAS